MTHDRTEQLIREAFAEEAARSADPREVLAAVRSRRPRNSYALILATAAVVVVVAAVAAFVVPKVFRESTPPATQQHQTTTVPPQNVLIIGTDTTDNTDSILLVQQAKDGATSVISLPRDSWVSSAGTMTKLNQIYRTAGIEALTAAVSDLTGVHIDHWAVADMTAVADLATEVGGVEVCLNNATTDPLSGADFQAGKQTLTGDAALAFIRQRHGLLNGDLDRVVRLQAFVHALLLKLDINHVPALLETLGTHLKTDKSLDTLGLLQSVSRENLRFATIPTGNPDFETPGGALAIQVDPAQVKQFVTDLPTTPPAPSDIPCVN